MGRSLDAVARALRIEYPGALYHLTSRGNGRASIFLDRLDHERFLALLARTVARSGWLCHAYCLMGNHYHLLVETPRPNLAQGMRTLNSSYAQAFNARHRRVGHLFQGRYKTVLVEKESHLLELCRYLVLNPVRARLVATASDWPWSSYHASAGDEPAPGFLTLGWVLGQFASDLPNAHRAYRRFVCEGLGQEPWQELRAGLYLGDEAFVARASQPGERVEEIARAQWQPLRPPLADLFAAHGEEAILLAYREFGYRLHEIGSHLDLHYATVSRRLRRLEAGRA